MAMRPATRATALFTPDAVPDWAGPMSIRAAVVTGATTRTRPIANSVMAGSTEAT